MLLSLTTTLVEILLSTVNLRIYLFAICIVVRFQYVDWIIGVVPGKYTIVLCIYNVQLIIIKSHRYGRTWIYLTGRILLNIEY